MSLIRNGGFERGNIDFWGVDTDATLEISTLSPKYGAYCGKFISSGDSIERIMNQDYIPVDAYNLIEVSGWIKSTTTRGVYIWIKLYDADYSHIKDIISTGRTMDGTYMLLSSQLVLPVNTSYIQCGFYIAGSSLNEVFYLDGFNAHIVTLESSLNGNITLREYGGTAVGGDTSDFKKDLKQFSTYYADLEVDAVSGSSPKLDVSVYELDYGGDPVLIGTFAQVIAASRERIVLTNPIGKEMYVVYTTPENGSLYYFRVDVTGKR